MKKTLALLMSVIVSGAIFIQCRQAAVSTSSNIAEISIEENNISKAQQAAEEFVKEYFTYNPSTIGEVLDKASSYFLNPKDILDGKDFQVKIIKSKNEVSTYILSTLGSKIEENIKIDNKEYKSYVLNFKIDYILDGKPIYQEIKLRMVNKDEKWFIASYEYNVLPEIEKAMKEGEDFAKKNKGKLPSESFAKTHPVECGIYYIASKFQKEHIDQYGIEFEFYNIINDKDFELIFKVNEDNKEEIQIIYVTMQDDKTYKVVRENTIK